MKIALVCRHFPPAISGGARRPYLLAKELEARRHDIVVLAPQPCEGLAVIVVPHPQIDPPAEPAAQTPRMRNRLREWLLLPDPDIRWALRAAGAPLPWRPDWVISTSPPESSHIAGWLIRRRHDCRWLADFRDHWVRDPLRPILRRSATRRWLERRMARFILPAADATAATTPAIIDEIAALGGPERAAAIPNFADPPPPRDPLPDGAINIVHTGGFLLSDHGRPLAPILAALEAAGREDLRLHLVGRLQSDEIRQVEQSSAAERIVVTGPLPLEEARAYQGAADVLLLVAGKTQVPGKLAEYRAAGKPMLVHGDGPWTAAAGLQPVSDLRAAFAALPGSAAPPPPGLTVRDAADRFLDLMLGDQNLSEGGR